MILPLICIVLFVWSMIDWFGASQKNSWVWIVTPFAWIALLFGVAFLAGPAAMSVIDQPLPTGGKFYVFPAAVIVSGLGMVLNNLSFWDWVWGVMWSRSH